MDPPRTRLVNDSMSPFRRSRPGLGNLVTMFDLDAVSEVQLVLDAR